MDSAKVGVTLNAAVAQPRFVFATQPSTALLAC